MAMKLTSSLTVAAATVALLLAAGKLAASPAVLPATPAALADALGARPSALLGEVHDNAAQHALRAAALRRHVERGARPALAFEQFDRERQAELDRVRRERPGDVDALVALGARGWAWAHYRPFLELALEYDLPIVAANLSRADALQVARRGWSGAFDTATVERLELDALPAPFLDAHVRAAVRGHCDLLTAEQALPFARAQIARDAAMAEVLRPHLARGVVLLTGNGHARNDVGVPFWLTTNERRGVTTIGIVERGVADDGPAAFDTLIVTEAAERPDPCEGLKQRLEKRN
jgi:uncharacterized iron-regulated protein